MIKIQNSRHIRKFRFRKLNLSRNFRDRREREVGEDPAPPELLLRNTGRQFRGSMGSRTLTSLCSGWCGDFGFSKFEFRASREAGQAVLTTVLFLLFVSTALLFSFASIALKETSASRLDILGKQSYFLAEAGVEDLVWRIGHGRQYLPSQTVTLGGTSVVVTVNTLGTTRTVEATGNISSAVRKARIVLTTGTGVSFVYGVQVGDLGLEMGNNSSIVGNVYSNGDIRGGGAANSTITGTAVSAGNHTIRDIRVNLDAYANTFQSCRVDGTAHYVTSTSSCTLGTVVHDVSPQPPGSFPITQSQIDGWKDDAEAGGILNGYSLGNNGSVSLGPKKINGNITFGNSSVLTLTGTVWVTGTITMGNDITIKLDPTVYGTASGLMIIDGSVDLGNTAILQGSGQSGSYLMLLSTYGPGDAIDLGNSASGAIFYAPNGVIDVGNNLSLREATARGLDVGNNASITYEAGLANVNFSSGPTGGWNIKSWNEVK